MGSIRRARILGGRATASVWEHLVLLESAGSEDRTPICLSGKDDNFICAIVSQHKFCPVWTMNEQAIDYARHHLDRLSKNKTRRFFTRQEVPTNLLAGFLESSQPKLAKQLIAFDWQADSDTRRYTFYETFHVKSKEEAAALDVDAMVVFETDEFDASLIKANITKNGENYAEMFDRFATESSLKWTWEVTTEHVFHPKVHVHITPDSNTFPISSNCQIQIRQYLSQDAFFDIYQFRMLFEHRRDLNWTVYGAVELEAPSSSLTSLPMLADFTLDLKGLKTPVDLEIPFHMRYQPARVFPDSISFERCVNVSIPAPRVSIKCQTQATLKERNWALEWSPLDNVGSLMDASLWTKLESATGAFVEVSMSQGQPRSISVEFPVGNFTESEAWLIQTATLFSTVLGSLLLLFQVIRVLKHDLSLSKKFKQK